MMTSCQARPQFFMRSYDATKLVRFLEQRCAQTEGATWVGIGIAETEEDTGSVCEAILEAIVHDVGEKLAEKFVQPHGLSFTMHIPERVSPFNPAPTPARMPSRSASARARSAPLASLPASGCRSFRPSCRRSRRRTNQASR